jgi:hypothetical protein
VAVAFARPPFRAAQDAALFSAARFAQEIARSALEQGVRIRAAVTGGEGALFDDANGQPAVDSPGAARVAELLDLIRPIAPDRPAFAFEGASFVVIALLQQRLSGWQRVEGPRGVALWLGPVD